MAVVLANRDAAVCCSTRRSGTRSRPTPSTRRRSSTGAASGSSARATSSTASTTRRSRTAGAPTTSTTRATPRQRTVLFADGVLQGSSTIGSGRERTAAIHRERPARVLRVPADPADDEHVHPATATARRPTSIVLARTRASTSPSSAAARSTPRAATSCSACSEGFLIESGEITTPVRGANLIGRAIEVMSAVDAVGRRLRHLGGRLRQGRPGRAGRQRLADAAHRQDHGRGHRCLSFASSCAAARRRRATASRRGLRRGVAPHRGRAPSAARSRASTFAESRGSASA